MWSDSDTIVIITLSSLVGDVEVIHRVYKGKYLLTLLRALLIFSYHTCIAKGEPAYVHVSALRLAYKCS